MRKRRAVAEINVVPYIDVMLVLLIIFFDSANADAGSEG
jgi:biopolymer transport protein TolR